MKYSNTLILAALFSFISYISCQHTTSLNFSGGVQPHDEPIFCPLSVCPSDNVQDPSCPSACPNACKLIPDKCCPSKKVAICADDKTDTLHPTGTATTTATVTTTNIATGTITPTSPNTPSSQPSGTQTTTGSNPAATTPSLASNMKPSICLSVLLFVFVYLLV
ncbi:hypothetical protein BJ944DRAFT_41151 [Cunninghamella echinulata]|nr:hypothetical protein BJ944DRAFT_41151 [Cunninghamella echinulata]